SVAEPGPSAVPSTQQRHRLRSEPFAATGEAEAVGGRRPDGYAAGLDAQGTGERRRHRVALRRDARLLADQQAVRVDELPAPAAHRLVRDPEELDRRGPPPALVSGGEEGSD